MTIAMDSVIFETFHRYNGTDEVWEQAAQLSGENYGVWGSHSDRSERGKRVTAIRGRLLRQYLPDDRSTCTRALIGGQLVAHAPASRWQWEGRTVCWITQLVFHKDFRRRGIATRLLQEVARDEDGVFGILSSHPAACKAAATASGEGMNKVELEFIGTNAGAVIQASSVDYMREAVQSGRIFDQEHISTVGLVSCADTMFFVDHAEPLRVLDIVHNGGWPLGELPEGHEFLLMIQRPVA